MKGYNTSEGYMGYISDGTFGHGRYMLFASECDYLEYIGATDNECCNETWEGGGTSDKTSWRAGIESFSEIA